MRWTLVLIIAVGNAAGDLLVTKGMKCHGEVSEFGPRGIRRLIGKLVRNGYVLAGIAGMAVSFFALLTLLSIASLSFAIPATAVTYVLETALAKILLGERVDWRRWAGASLVAGGVALLSLH